MSAPALTRGKTGRRYVWPPGTDKPELVVPSVTTILGQASKPALVNWAAREVAIYAVEHLDSWKGLDATSAIDVLKRAPYRNMSKKGDLGSAVHAAIDVWLATDEQEPTGVDLELVPYIAGAITFIEDWIRDGGEILWSEATIYSRAYKYAGTCDLLARLNDGRYAVIDWKSGKDIYPETALQLCAYANGEFIGTDDGNELEMPRIDVGIAVHLTGKEGKDAYTAQEVAFTPRMFKTFLALRSLQLWKDDYEADALGPKLKGGPK